MVDQNSSNSDDYSYYFVDLMNKSDVPRALTKLDGAIRLDNELLVSQAGLSEAMSMLIL